MISRNSIITLFLLLPAIAPPSALPHWWLACAPSPWVCFLSVLSSSNSFVILKEVVICNRLKEGKEGWVEHPSQQIEEGCFREPVWIRDPWLGILAPQALELAESHVRGLTRASFLETQQLRVNRATSRLSPRSRVLEGPDWARMSSHVCRVWQGKKWAGQGPGAGSLSATIFQHELHSVSKYSELDRLWRRYICQRRMIECIHSTVDSFPFITWGFRRLEHGPRFCSLVRASQVLGWLLARRYAKAGALSLAVSMEGNICSWGRSSQR